MLLIGLTGGFGSGKTTVARMFHYMGAYIIDADKICHDLMMPGKNVYKRALSCFGKDIVQKRHAIDKIKLSSIVFNNTKKLKMLNNIVHPEVIKEIRNRIKKNKKRRCILVDAPLLIECGLYKEMNVVIVVKTSGDRQIKRLRKKDNIAREDALKRIKTQMPFKKKMSFADFIIDNNGSKKKTLVQVKRIWKQLGVCYGGKREIRH